MYLSSGQKVGFIFFDYIQFIALIIYICMSSKTEVGSAGEQPIRANLMPFK